jgi:hypothetical protein
MKQHATTALMMIMALWIMSCSSGRKTSDGWFTLFDGTSLNDWIDDAGEGAFSIENGELIAQGGQSVLYYDGAYGTRFKNFELKARVMTTEGSESRLVFHTRHDAPGGYKVQICNDPGYENGFRKTGSLYRVRDVYKTVAQDDQWFDLHILVIGNLIQVHVNGVHLVDYSENVPSEFQPGVLSSGTFAIEAGSGRVAFKDIMVRPLRDNASITAGREYFTPEKQNIVNNLISYGYPLIDYHVHMKGGVVLEDILDKSRRTGIFGSVAPNCGIGFPIDNNEKLEAFHNEFQNVPIFLAMQAEGREWVNIFKKESIARYDYVFTDAMTFSDRKGRRMQIWKDEQVVIDDPEDFMELLVETIEDVLDNEKIDIYVNATFLPTILADRYDELWTEARMDRVVDALVRNDIALEVSARYRIPGPALIKKAMDRGVKLAFGTNNSDEDFANLDYCLEMIEECGIQPGDMFLPRSHGFKPIQVK